jgi:hypothetical protein
MKLKIFLNSGAGFAEADGPSMPWKLSYDTGLRDKDFLLILPATPANNALFAADRTFDVFIEQSGMRLYSGRMRILSATRSEILPQQYECIFYRGWKDPLAGVYLSDLGFGSHTFDAATVEASWSAGADSLDYVYPVISYGRPAQGNYLSVSDLRPALYVRNILIKAFAKAGYSCKSDFLDSEYFSKLVLPYYGHFRRADFTVNSQSVKASATDQVISSESTAVQFNPDDDSSGQWAADTFTATATSHYSFMLQAVVRNSTGTAISGSFSVEINGIFAFYLTGLQQEAFQPGASLFRREFYLLLTAGDTVRICALTSSGTDELSISSDTILSIRPTGEIQEGDVINFNEILDDHFMPLSGLIEDIGRIFNLKEYTDHERKIVYLEPWNDFYADTATDWTAGTNNFTTIDAGPVSTLLRFATDRADGLVDAWETANRRPFLSYLNTPEKASVQNIISTLYIAPTMMGNTDIAGLPVPLLWNTAEQGEDQPAYSNDFNPRLLIYAGLQENYSFNWKNYGAGSEEFSLTALPLAFSVNPLLDNSVQSLSFDSHAGLDALQVETGLYHNFYRPSLESAALLKFNTTLSAPKISGLRGSGQLWRTLIFINGKYHTLHSLVEYDPNDGSCEVTLREYNRPIPSTAINHYPADLSIYNSAGFRKISALISLRESHTLPDSFGILPAARNSSRLKSTVLQNGSGNAALPASGAVVMAVGGAAVASQFIAGRYNQPNTEALFQVGNGTSNANRSTAFEITDSNEDGVKGWINGEQIITTANPETPLTTSVSESTHVPGDALPLTLNDTFDGYTLSQVVKALRLIGLLQ